VLADFKQTEIEIDLSFRKKCLWTVTVQLERKSMVLFKVLSCR